MQFKQYDVVKLKAVTSQANTIVDEFNLRQPVVGDVATIIEVYLSPPGYELECSDSNGITQWLVAFDLDDVELELKK